MNHLRLLAFIIIANLSFVGCSSVFYHPSKALFVDPIQLNLHPEDVYFLSKTGKRLHGWYFKASQRPPKGLILHFHGNAQNLSAHYLFLREATDKGYDYFIFDYEGYGQSEGTPSPENLILDGVAAIEWARAKSPNLPMIIFGQSLGGNVAINSLTEFLKTESRPSSIKALVVDSSFASYRSAARKVVSRHLLTWILQPVAWLIVDNSGSADGKIEKVSPIPVLIIHGENDKVVDFSLGLRLFDQAHEPREMWIIPHGGHTDFLSRPDWNRRFYQKLDSYIKGHL